MSVADPAVVRTHELSEQLDRHSTGTRTALARHPPGTGATRNRLRPRGEGRGARRFITARRYRSSGINTRIVDDAHNNSAPFVYRSSTPSASLSTEPPARFTLRPIEEMG
jgi:hypothetical protein